MDIYGLFLILSLHVYIYLIEKVKNYIDLYFIAVVANQWHACQCLILHICHVVLNEKNIL